MKKSLIAFLFLATFSVVFLSCQKSAVEPAQQPAKGLSAEQKAALINSAKSYYDNKVAPGAATNRNGATFIVPFFSIEAWGFAKYDPGMTYMSVVYFAAPLSDNDFYRENPDGTVSVHINSRNADIYYFPNILDENAPFLFGTGGRYSSNYTGPVVDYGNGFKFIDLENLRNASVHGSGKVSETGLAPWKTLLLKFIANPSGLRETEFTVR